jgi:REP element-mobilizing transposase RayT
MMTVKFYRRNLPHWQPEHCPIFLTWRLYGSLPKGFAERLREWSGEPGKQFLNADIQLDAASSGPLWLNDPEIAGQTRGAIERGAELGHYVLRAWAIMPNHVHVLLDPLVPLARITLGIKRASAKDANARLGRTGKPFWQDESFDHWVRGPGQFARIQTYIENNPVKAGLCARPQDWPWSSAHK